MNISDVQVADFLDSVQGIMAFADENGFNDFNGLKNRFQSLQERFHVLKTPDNESHLVKCAVVGAFSCGKSQFINSLLGEEIAPVEITPLTHGLTSFRYGEKEVITDGEGKKISRSKYVKDVQDISSAGSHFVVEHPMVPEGLEIIDSPGFSAIRSDDAAAKKDLELSKEAVGMADIVFLLINIAEGTITKECLSYIQTTLDLKSQPLFIILTWGETKTARKRERIRNEIISQCKKHGLPLEDCIPYCSMGEEYILDNYSEEYKEYFRECRERMFKMLNGLKTFKKDQSRTYSTAKHGLFLKALTEFQTSLDLIVSGFKTEVIERKYDKKINQIKTEYTETAEEIAQKCGEFCDKKADNTSDESIADTEMVIPFFEYRVNTKYKMSELGSDEEKDLFIKIKNVLNKKNAFLRESLLGNKQNEISSIYRSVVTSLLKKHERTGSLSDWWGNSGAYEVCKRLVRTMREEFWTSAKSFLPEIKNSLESGFKQEINRLIEEKKTLCEKWDSLENRFSQTSKTIMEGFDHESF